MNNEHVRSFIETIHRTDFNAIGVFALDTVLDDDVSHGAGLHYFHHFEIRLWRTTLGAKPIVRNIRPWRPCCNTFVWQAFCFVIDESAGHALPLVHHVHKKSLGFWGERGASAALETETQSPSCGEDYLTKILGYSLPGNRLLRLNPSTSEVVEMFATYTHRAPGDCHQVTLARRCTIHAYRSADTSEATQRPGPRHGK